MNPCPLTRNFCLMNISDIATTAIKNIPIIRKNALSISAGLIIIDNPNTSEMLHITDPNISPNAIDDVLLITVFSPINNSGVVVAVDNISEPNI